VGHYVVLVQYDRESDTFQVCDPGVAADRRCIKRDALDRARKQHGMCGCVDGYVGRCARAALCVGGWVGRLVCV
jgi:hypothetical protein